MITTYEEIISFCNEKHPEDENLDYKEVLPSKGLSKLIAAFSNKTGGQIIVGVKEDSVTGVPVSWSGIKFESSLIETIYQDAANVTPYPSLHIQKIDGDGKGDFIIIRIDEGTNTPYFVKGDSNVWVRTGNIRTPVGIATPEWLELLYQKRERAQKSRQVNKKVAEIVYESALKREDKTRIDEIAQAKALNNGSEKNFFQFELGTHVELCSLVLQPHYPKIEILTPQQMLDKFDEIRPHFLEHRLEPIPQGVLSFFSRYDGYIDCKQVYPNGFVYNKFDVLQTAEDKATVIYLSYIVHRLYSMLSFANTFYKISGFSGTIDLEIELLVKNDNRLFVKAWNSMFPNENRRKAFLPKYKWEFQINTNELGDQVQCKKVVFEIFREIHWSAGYREVPVQAFENYIKENGFNFQF